LGFEGSAEAGSLGVREGVGEDQGCGSFSREGGRAVGEERSDGWGRVGRERRREGCGAFFPGLLLGRLAPGRPSWVGFSFFVLILFYFLFLVLFD
jgi:hypothetical protein